jgi:pyruvate dehydrogenase E2 component (dihydrolipoamide acetyltransferase)
MRRDFKLPDLGEGLTEGEVIKWLVAEGDTVTLNQPIVEVETAKAAVELPSPYAGTVVGLHAGEGDVVEVGTVLISFETGDAAAANGARSASAKGAAAADAAAAVGPAEAGASTPAPAEPAEPAPAPEEDGGRQATLVGPGPRATELRRRRRAAATPSEPAPVAEAPVAEAPAAPAARPKATPPVRKFARDRGVDLALISGTGKDGRITRADVEEALAARAEPEPAAPAAAARVARERAEERIQVRGTRRAIAARMAASYSTIPHVTEFLTVDATELVALRDTLRSLPAAAEVKVTPLAIVAKAVCAAVRDFPLMNSAWVDGDGGAPDEIVVKRWVNLGIATDTEGGLVVPNVKDADTLGILDLARDIGRLAGLARSRSATPADLTGGTITITNVGGFGVEAGTPIINKPECAIVATGTIAERPWVVGGELAVRSLMTVSVSFDHRIVDGAYAARFLTHLRDLLERPVLLAAF